METKFYLTNCGNILNIEKECFQTMTGRFLRLVSESEMEYLQNVLVPVAFPEGIQEPVETPVWRFICHAESKFFHRYATGGVEVDGGYHTIARDYFFGRNNNGVPEFRVVTIEESELTWQNNSSPIRIFDTDIEFFAAEEGDVEEDAQAPLDAYSEPCTARDVLYTSGTNVLTFQERVERYKKLKELGAIVFPSHQRRKRKR